MNPLKPHFLIISVLLISAGCSEDRVSYALLEGEREIEFPDGYIGCEWETHVLKMKPPLSGELAFRAINCYKDKRYRPKYGYKRLFSVDWNNTLKIGKFPYDPDYLTTKQEPYAYLSVIAHNGAPETVMRRYLKKSDHKHCELDVTPTGRWQIGLSKKYYEELGYSFPFYNQPCPLNIGYSEGEMACLSDDFFPHAQQPLSNICSVITEDSSTYTAFRVSGPVVFAYRQGELESHPENIRPLDPYSIRYIP